MNYREAIERQLQLIEQNPQDVRLVQKAGELYQKAGEPKLAGEMFFRVAQRYRDDGFLLKAVALFKQVLRLNPLLVGAREALASTLLQLGLHEDAVSQYQELLGIYRLAGAAEDAVRTLETLSQLGVPSVEPGQKG